MSIHVSRAERMFAMLLRAYPAEFRSRFAREMALVFRAQLRDSSERGVRFWADVLWDVGRSAPALHMAALRARWDADNQLPEGTMRPMAILALLTGVIQIVNAMLEASAGRSSLGDGYSLAGVTLGFAAAALLVVAGVVLLRRGSDAAGLVRLAAAGCVALVVLIRFVQPWMSIFGMLVGISVPIALLVFLSVTGRRGPTGPRTA